MADHEELNLNPDGGLTTLVDLRRPIFGRDTSRSSLPAVVRDPNQLRLERMLKREHLVYGIPTPYVGRRQALESVYNAVRGAVNRQELVTIAMVGGPGAGKTRLVAELFAIIDPIRRGIEVHAASCSESEPPDGLAVVEQLVRGRFSIAATDPEGAARAKIRSGVQNLVAEPIVDTATRLLSILAGLSVADGDGDPSDRSERRAVKTWYNLVRYDATHAPQVLVLHRAQFLTPRATEVLTELVNALRQTPTILIMLSDQAPPAELVRASPEHTSIALERLEDHDVERLVRAILHKVEVLPEHLVKDVVARSAGNPGVVEDNIRILIQRGIIQPGEDKWRVDSRGPVLGLAGSKADASRERLKALNPKIKAIIEKASVFGPSFWFGGLLALMRSEPYEGDKPLVPWVDDRLEVRLNNAMLELRRQEVVVFHSQSAIEGHVEFSFVDREDQVALYMGLEDEKRTLYHRMAAQWLAGLELADPRPWYNVIAFHLDQGGRAEHAAEFYLEAAQASAAGYDYARSVEMYRRALALVDVDRADILVDVLSGLGDVLFASGDFSEARRVYGALLEATLIAKRMDQGAMAWLKLGRTHRALGDYKRARPSFNCAKRLYERLEDDAGIAASMDDIAKVIWLEGGRMALEEALKHFREALRMRRAVGDARSVAESLSNIANVHLQLGNRLAAGDGFREALALRRQAGDRAGEAACLVGIGAVRYADGDREGAIDAWRNGLDLAEAVGDRELIGIFLNNLGEGHLEGGDLARARTLLSEAHELTTETGDQRTLADVLRNLGALAVKNGDWNEALERADEAIAVAQRIGARGPLALALRTRGEILGRELFVDDGGRSQSRASACFEQSIQLLEQIGDELELEQSLKSYARFMQERGQLDKAAELAARAKRLSRRIKRLPTEP